MSCQLNETVSALDSDTPLFKKQSKEPSGEDIVRSVFFLQDNIQIDVLATLNNKYKNLPDSVEQEYNTFVDEIIYKMDSIAPSFFDNFKHTVKTGTAQEIEAKLGEVALLIKTSFLLNENYRKAYNRVDGIVSNMDLSKYNLDDAEGMNAFVKAVEGQIPSDEVDCGSVFVCAVAAVYVVAGLYAAAVATVVAAVGVAVYAIAAVVTEQRFWTGCGGEQRPDDIHDPLPKPIIKEQIVASLINLYI